MKNCFENTQACSHIWMHDWFHWMVMGMERLGFSSPCPFFFPFIFFFSVFVADSNYIVWVFIEACTYLSTWALPLGNSSLVLVCNGVNLVLATIRTGRHQDDFCSSITWWWDRGTSLYHVGKGPGGWLCWTCLPLWFLAPEPATQVGQGRSGWRNLE